MRILVALICSLALVSVAQGQQKQEKKSQQKKQAQTAQRPAQPTRQPTGAGKKPPVATYQGQKTRQGQTSAAAHPAQKSKNNQTSKYRKGSAGKIPARQAHPGQSKLARCQIYRF